MTRLKPLSLLGTALVGLSLTLATASHAAEPPVALTPATTFDTLKEGLSAYTRRDYTKAQTILSPLARAGNVTARYMLASIQLNARPPQPAGETEMQKLAGEGHIGAMRDLGKLYYAIQIPPRIADARKWLTEAAQRSDPEAQNMLGILYLKGEGDIQPDPVQAYMWLSLAAERGDAASGLMLENERYFTPAVRAEGAARARQWKPQR
jgi:uncharacterized protein